jgi:hypothetical protein
MKKTGAIAALLAVVVGGIFSASTIAIIQQSAQAFIDLTTDIRSEPKAPMAASEEDGNNVYVVWWTNRC